MTSSGRPGGTVGALGSAPQTSASSACSRALGPEESEISTPAPCARVYKFNPIRGGPFLFRLAGGEMKDDGMAGENHLGVGGQRGVGADFEPWFRGKGDVPGAEDVQVVHDFMAGGVGFLDAAGVGEAADEVGPSIGRRRRGVRVRR